LHRRDLAPTLHDCDRKEQEQTILCTPRKGSHLWWDPSFYTEGSTIRESPLPDHFHETKRPDQPAGLEVYVLTRGVEPSSKWIVTRNPNNLAQHWWKKHGNSQGIAQTLTFGTELGGDK
jgi:hypothetical protein